MSDQTQKKKVLIFVVCYNAEHTIEPVLDRVPASVWENDDYRSDALILDDQSPDSTFYRAYEYSKIHPQRHVTVLYNPKNQGYGGNLKIGCYYAMKNNYDAIVLLHGDGQYSPACLDRMIRPIIEDRADVVLGSRMTDRLAAIRGKMPLYKWIGNQVLTFLQNMILKSRLSEFHSGYRAYSVKALSAIPFEYNSNSFDFDTDVIIQLLDTGRRLEEVPVPVFYGNEIRGIGGIRYSWRVVKSCLVSRLNRLGIYYHPRFDYEKTNTHYEGKFGYASSHQFALDSVAEGATAIDLGCGPGFMAGQLKAKNVRTVSVDLYISQSVRQDSWKCIETNVEQYDFSDDFGKVDYVLVLDLIEHLKSPERLLQTIRRRFSKDSSCVVITTGNIAFFPLRIGLLFGSFNFGKRGVLDLDHSRLFTFHSLVKTLEMNGYEVVSKRGIPAPFPLAVGRGPLADFLLWLNRLLIFVSKSLFAYQIAIIARPMPTLEHLLEDAHGAKDRKLREMADRQP